MIMATVASLTRDEGATFLIDGEEEPTTKKYTSGAFNLNVGDRVVLEEIGDSYTVISKTSGSQSFDVPDGDYSRYFQLKPGRAYLLIETCWNTSDGEKTSVSNICIALAATPVRNTSSTEIESIKGYNNPFSSSNNYQIYYNKNYGRAHVSIIEL